MSNVLSIKNLSKTYTQGSESLNVLEAINLDIDAGAIVAMVGPSGSGKSSLLHCVGLLDKPTQGNVIVNGQDCTNMNDAMRTAMRRDMIGFVYQFHYLQQEFSALENTMMPLIIRGASKKDARGEAMDMLERLKVDHRAKHRPARLSGGEQQRVAIARALIGKPKLLLADEPTGNLDPETSDNVFALLMEAVREQNTAALIATHNLDLASKMDRVFKIES